MRSKIGHVIKCGPFYFIVYEFLYTTVEKLEMCSYKVNCTYGKSIFVYSRKLSDFDEKNENLEEKL